MFVKIGRDQLLIETYINEFQNQMDQRSNRINKFNMKKRDLNNQLDKT